MDFIEVEGKTYEEAVKKAAASLEAEEKDLDIEITEVDTKGILGLLGSKKIRKRPGAGRSRTPKGWRGAGPMRAPPVHPQGRQARRTRPKSTPRNS